MPVSPELAAGLAQATVDLYTQAERLLLARIARTVAQGMGSPTWAEQKLIAVQAIRQYATDVLAQLQQEMAGAVGQAVTVAANRGGAAAAADLRALTGGPLEDYADPLATLTGRAQADALIREAVARVGSTHLRILRTTEDTYRDVVNRAAGQVALGTQTRREAAQRALDEFADRGVTGFVDRRGRQWDMASYVEMAVRTAAANAAVQAHADRLQAYGQDLVLVFDAPQECELCRPWEGKVLSLSGFTVGTVSGAQAARVTATLATATAAGLFHPGCRHSIALYQPGVTRLPGRTADPEGDAARQHLRYLERQVRASKRREAAALDDRARQAARARVRRYQAAIREHVDTTSAKRQPQREQVGRAR